MYAPVSSSETRIVIDKNTYKNSTKEELNAKNYIVKDNYIYNNYSINKYEGIMSYFNRYLRVSYYEHNIKNKYIDHCCDCNMMINLLEKYKNKYSENKFSNTDVSGMIDNLYNIIPNISHRCLNHRKSILKDIINKN